jgi:hypothetical protein
MGEAKRKARIFLDAMANFPSSFKADISKGGQLDPRFDPSTLADQQLLIGYLIATNDLEEDDGSDSSFEDVKFWDEAHDKGLTLLDLANTWGKKLVDDLDQADAAERDGTKIYDYERDHLIERLTGNVELSGAVNDELVDYLENRWFCNSWDEVEALNTGYTARLSYGARIVRLKEAHEAGVTLAHVAKGVASVVMS